MDLSLHLVRQVRPAVESRTRRTPMRRSEPAERRAGTAVWLKLESQQVTGSFKARGPLAVRALRHDPQRWVAASAGNHGLGVAYALRGVGAPPHVFVPRSAARVKRDAIAALDAEITVVDSTRYDDAEAAAKQWAEDHDALFVSPFDDPLIMAGNGGTLALEVLEQLPDVQSIVVPVGGGGLASGIGCAVRALRPGVRLVGVQSEATCAMHDSLQRRAAILRHSAPETLAEGLEGGVSVRSYEYVSRWFDDVQLVSEQRLAEAMRWLWEHHELRVEGSAAVGIAALLDGLAPPGPVCVILTGCNVDDDTWERVMTLTS
jgi:threonine dehydratase